MIDSWVGGSLIFVMSMVNDCCLYVDLGYRWAAALQKHVGEILSGCQRYSVSMRCDSKGRWLYFCIAVIRILCCAFRYMVDAADRDKVEASRNELHNLLDKPQLQGIPVRGGEHLHSVWCIIAETTLMSSSLIKFQFGHLLTDDRLSFVEESCLNLFKNLMSSIQLMAMGI